MKEFAQKLNNEEKANLSLVVTLFKMFKSKKKLLMRSEVLIMLIMSIIKFTELKSLFESLKMITFIPIVSNILHKMRVT